MNSRFWKVLEGMVFAALVVALAGACGPAIQETLDHSVADTLELASLEPGEELKVVATTNIIGDVVALVGGDQIELTTLMSAGMDPHTYVPTPAHTAAVHDAHVVFANGLGLEVGLENMLESAGGDAVQVQLSSALALREAASKPTDHQEEVEHEHEDDDPHVWFDVQNVIRWVETIERTFSALDPDNKDNFQANAEGYIQELEALDAWVEEQISTIPEANRKLVTNHPSFGHLADRYGLEQLGAVYPVSPSSEPSAQDIAALEDAILEYGVPAVFAESTVNPKLAQQVAKDTGVKLVPLYSGSLGKPGSGAESYILLIRYDVSAIVEALR
jgi:manganese/iron transport system substrate-binding protein